MRDTGDDWTRRHARLVATGDRAENGPADRERVVKADPPADDWSVRHAWCER
ncbi:hypothetical protein [Halosimplex amylolyticum]|uniref:hypothetical protein n=1 Tax=Halosimplex amylolyticum TaxID=3396616 RepID=UPI003F555173